MLDPKVVAMSVSSPHKKNDEMNDIYYPEHSLLLYTEVTPTKVNGLVVSSTILDP